MNNGYTLKQYLGALFIDCPIYISTLFKKRTPANESPWLWVRNRKEILKSSTYGEGVKCDWMWTTDLYLPKLFPKIGKWLVSRALNDCPIRLADVPSELSAMPEVSFLIGHRGLERLPLLLMTLKSIAAQTNCHFECIVVEQDNERLIQDKIPAWVKYLHTPLPEKEMPYSRSWAFNVAARAAKSNCMIFHDNDMLVPYEYAYQLLKYHKKGYEFINLKRFIFYYTKADSAKIISENKLFKNCSPESVVQNLEAGGSFGASRQAYFDIGGFDEKFVGWGGEDNEFWERANTRKVYPFGFLPIIHLWHASQPEKNQENNPTLAYQRAMSKVPAEIRITKLLT